MEDNKNNIFKTPLDFLIGDRFGKYAKYVIQDRALPDVRDGLKPVQRRIIYAMLVNGNLPNKGYKKSATAVGYVIGHYHPHGDTSVYDAMVRMSQWWKSNMPLIDMQGNNGSLDDDPPAAMRYTEAKLSNIAMELVKDIDKDTVLFAPNYDDSTLEPTVLPSKFPNLLVNGADGIAAGYSTTIPPHNFNETIDATIYRIKNPNCSVDDLIDIMPGPDFPTGGIIRGKENLKEALSTGSGSIQIEAKYEIINNRTNNSIVISEIPFGVIKQQLVYSIDKIRLDKEIDGIIEVRDETDRKGLRIVIEIKKEADINSIISYLMKKTKLSVRYTYNLITICDKKPLKLGIDKVIDYYIKHQIETINNRTKFDLKNTLSRYHILSGMIKGISDIDTLIHIVRTSKSKEEIKNRLCERFDIDLSQAEAIVTIQLHRLNSVDIDSLKQECEDLNKLAKKLESIIDNESKIRKVIIDELSEINKKYITPRRSEIKDEINEYVIEKRPIIKEDVIVSITHDGYVKRSSLKSFNSSNSELPSLKEGDYFISIGNSNTSDTIIAFTNKGNYLFIPTYNLNDIRYKDEGKHISSLISISGDEKIIASFNINEFRDDICFVLLTKKGMIKKTKISDFNVNRFSKPIMAIKLSDESDELVSVNISDNDSICIVGTHFGNIIAYHEDKISIIGTRASGVKAINLDKNDYCTTLLLINRNDKSNIIYFTDKGFVKVFNLSNININQRMSKPTQLYKFFRSEPSYLLNMYKYDLNTSYYLFTNKNYYKNNFDIKASPISKSLKNSIFNDESEVLRNVNLNNLITINKDTTAFKLTTKIEKINKIEESVKEKTIFDYLDEIENE